MPHITFVILRDTGGGGHVGAEGRGSGVAGAAGEGGGDGGGGRGAGRAGGGLGVLVLVPLALLRTLRHRHRRLRAGHTVRQRLLHPEQRLALHGHVREERVRLQLPPGPGRKARWE